MIHSLTPVQWDRNQLEMALGLDLLRRMRKAEVGLGLHGKSRCHIDKCPTNYLQTNLLLIPIEDNTPSVDHMYG